MIPSVSNKKWLIKSLVAWLILFSAFGQKVFAWGDDGHRIVGEIARTHLSRIVNRELAEEFNIKSLANIAPWADKIKNRRSQKSWHYTNIQKGKWTYDQKRDCPGRQCVTEKIRDFANILQDKNHSAKIRQEALAYLVHFVADIHQPLHLGNRSDRGGNRIKVRFDGELTNLHALWDHGLLQVKGKSLLQYVRQLACKITPGDRLPPSRLPVEVWANESRELALKYAYPVTFSKNRELTPQYIRSSRKIVEHQLCRAGIRLANLLNGILAE